jgi:hypothetical protein
MLSDVSEEGIASIFRVEEKRRKSGSEEPALPSGCGLSHQSKTPSYIKTGRKGRREVGHMGNNREERVGSVGMGEQVVGSRKRVRVGIGSLSVVGMPGLPSEHSTSSLGTNPPRVHRIYMFHCCICRLLISSSSCVTWGRAFVVPTG